MIPPVKPENEESRINALRALNILDTTPEERFDRLTRLAKRLFNVPIVLVSLVDSDRQWFKSIQGLPVTETPRDISFCGHAILQEEILLVPDTNLDKRFHDNPLVTGEPRIRFYAGYPLKVPNGSAMGTLCLIDVQPRTLDTDELAILSDLAKMAEQEIAAVQLATLDELTMISNRRGFEALGQNSLNLCKRAKKTATLLFIDLDDFKPINDKFGHAEGDIALRVFADTLRHTLRESDVFGRLGGDEFVALLTQTDREHTLQLIERMRSSLTEYFEQANRGYRISFSVGVAEYDPNLHADITSLMNAADQLMYEQKRQSKKSENK